MPKTTKDISKLLSQEQKKELSDAFCYLDMWDLVTNKIWISSDYLPKFKNKIKEGKSSAHIGHLWSAECYVTNLQDKDVATLTSTNCKYDPSDPPEDYIVLNLKSKEISIGEKVMSYVGYSYSYPELVERNKKLQERIDGLEKIVNSSIQKILWRKIKKWVREKMANPPRPQTPSASRNRKLGKA
jgi:hypothetical protein